MIQYTQSKVSVKNTAGESIVYGNCYPTAIASFLGIPPTEVPNIETLFDVSVTYAYDVMDEWLKQRGLKMNHHAFEYCVFHEDDNILDDGHRKWLDEMHIDVKQSLMADRLHDYYFVSGKSPRGFHHICIYKAGELVHDPHPTKEGLLTIDQFETIGKWIYSEQSAEERIKATNEYLQADI